jgi:amino acid permease
VAAAGAIGSALLVESKRALAEAGVLGAEVVPQAA